MRKWSRYESQLKRMLMFGFELVPFTSSLAGIQEDGISIKVSTSLRLDFRRQKERANWIRPRQR